MLEDNCWFKKKSMVKKIRASKLLVLKLWIQLALQKETQLGERSDIEFLC